MLRRFRNLSFIAFLFVAACVTVNVYFPAAAIQKAADQIVDDVTGVKDKQKPEKKPDVQSLIFNKLLSIDLGPKEVYAQADISVSTPAIRSIRQSMRENFQQLKPFYIRGNVGENNNGFAEIRNTSDLKLNKYRTELYTEIVKANKLDANSVPQVRKIFANSWRNKAQANWWIQSDSGEWEKKQ